MNAGPIWPLKLMGIQELIDLAVNGVDIIKEYLVSLGFSVDGNKYAQFQNHLKQMTRTVEGQVGGMTANIVKAAGVITAAYGSIVAGTISLMANTAKADMQYQLFATRMWMAQGAAKNFKIALDAIGYSMEDVAWNPELRAQFFELEKLSSRLQGGMPSDMSATMRGIREIMFGFKQVKVEIAYASQWISYYLNKYLAGPFNHVRKIFSRFQEKIIGDMPNWTKKVASFLATIINVGASAFRAIKDLFVWFKNLWDSFPKGVKTAIVALGALGAFLMMGPIGQISAVIGGILILIDDFYAYIDGRKSSKTLAPIWKFVIDSANQYKDTIQSVILRIRDFWGEMTKSGVVDTAVKSFGKIGDAIKNIYTVAREFIKKIIDKVVELYDKLKDNGVIAKFGQVIKGIFETVGNLTKGIGNVVKVLWNFIEVIGKTEVVKVIWEGIKNVFSTVLSLVLTVAKALLGVLDSMGLALQGKLGAAGKRMSQMWDDYGKEMLDIVKPIIDGQPSGKPKPVNTPVNPYGGGTNGSTVNQTQINIKIDGSNLTAEQLAEATKKGVLDAQNQIQKSKGREVALNTRDLSGVFG
jgi:hypothetical protein